MSKFKRKTTWTYLSDNFHKFSENKKVDIALSVIKGRKIRWIDLEGREINSSKSVKWRKAVFARDNYVCQICMQTGKLQAHHIKSWTDYPELRYDIENGVTLCIICHRDTHRKTRSCEQENYALC